MFIKLTTTDNETIIVNTDYISRCYPKSCEILFNDSKLIKVTFDSMNKFLWEVCHICLVKNGDE